MSHMEALNQVVREHGFDNWNNYQNCQPTKSSGKHEIKRPAIPATSALDYYNVITGAIIDQHPNRKMSVKRHKKVGKLIKEVMDAVEYYKRANNAIFSIRSTLETWLGNEYNERELPTEEFNKIYLGRSGHGFETSPSNTRKATLKRNLKIAWSILLQSYHDCKPMEKLEHRFKLAFKALDNWPARLRTPIFYYRGQLRPGTLVRIKNGKNTLGIVFHHDYRRKLVEGYSDGGIFHAARHEVTILKNQSTARNFKPMRLYLPYGKWRCESGKEVLFNRDYSPIWERSPKGRVRVISPNKEIDFLEQEFFYDDRSAPYYNNEVTLQRCQSILMEWGVHEKTPKVLNMLTEALSAGDVRLLSPKGVS